MRNKLLAALCALMSLSIVSAAIAANEPVTAQGAKLEKLAGDFAFTEGATCDPEGNVFFTDQPNDRIMEWTVEGKLIEFMKPAGRSNGMMFTSKGELVACADEKNEMWVIDTDKKHKTVLKDYKGKLLNGPNDVWLRPGGGLYFTDPFYKRDYWKRGPKEQEVEAVYFVPEIGKPAVRVIDDLKQPNGITGTPDGKTLYVADIGAGKTYAYDIKPDGTLTKKRLFCESGSDGATVDSAGNVYLTGKGVFVFDKTGKRIEHIEVPEDWCANVCFGGKDRKTLFITASKGLYAIKMRVAGVDRKGGK